MPPDGTNGFENTVQIDFLRDQMVACLPGNRGAGLKNDYINNGIN
jgi:hypothetical protein